MRKMIFIFLLCVLSFCVSAEVRVRSSINPQVVSPGDILTLIVEVEYQSEKNIDSLRLPKMRAFHFITQDHFNYDGKTSKRRQYRYTLQPMRLGKLYIGSIEVMVDGKVYKTSPMEVLVSSPSSSPFGSLNQLFPPSLFNRDEDFSPFSLKNIRKKDVFVRLEMEKSTLYIGEMVLAEWFIYLPGNQNVNMANMITKSAEMDGFWVESVLTPEAAVHKPPRLEEKGGKRYKKQIFASSALFPVRTGDLSISPLEVKSHFMAPFSLFGSTKVFINQSNEMKIKVLPLPLMGKGIFFTEAVGDFEISASVNRKTASVQEPVLYKVRFKGIGNPRLIRLPDLNFGDSLKVYDITESQKFSVSESIKDFEIILIPKSTGDHLIPSFELSTFDPQLGIYKIHVLPPFQLKVVGVPVFGRFKSKLYFGTDKKLQKKEGAQEDSEDMGADKLTPYLWSDKPIGFIVQYRKYFWFVIYSLLLVFFILALKRLFLSREGDDSLKVQLKKSMKRVDLAIKSGQWKESGIELNQIMYSFFSDLSGQKKIVKNWDVLLQNLNPSIRIKYEPRIRNIVSRVEKLSFASFEKAKKLRNERNVEQLKQDTTELIQEIFAS